MVTSKIENVPFIIMEALKDMPLGSDYTIYPKENSATIVYKRAGFCGA
jgi:hypothetical protein